MPIISKETWDKFTQEEQHKLKTLYRENEEFGCAENNIDLERIFPKECLQPQPLTYRDVERELFKDKKAWYINDNSAIQETLHLGDSYRYKTNLMTSRKQAEKLLAINKLLNVAKYLNKDWKPDEGNVNEFWVLGICKYNDEIEAICVGNYDYRTEIVYFRTEELAKQAIQILGEDTVRLALTTDF